MTTDKIKARHLDDEFLKLLTRKWFSHGEQIVSTCNGTNETILFEMTGQPMEFCYGTIISSAETTGILKVYIDDENGEDILRATGRITIGTSACILLPMASVNGIEVITFDAKTTDAPIVRAFTIKCPNHLKVTFTPSTASTATLSGWGIVNKLV